MIKKTYVTVGSSVLYIDTIEHEGQLWLVPDWIVLPDGKRMTPLRIVCISKVGHMQTGDGNYVVHQPIPKSVMDGSPTPEEESEFEIVESPAIILPNPDVLN